MTKTPKKLFEDSINFFSFQSCPLHSNIVISDHLWVNGTHWPVLIQNLTISIHSALMTNFLSYILTLQRSTSVVSFK